MSICATMVVEVNDFMEVVTVGNIHVIQGFITGVAWTVLAWVLIKVAWPELIDGLKTYLTGGDTKQVVVSDEDIVRAELRLRHLENINDLIKANESVRRAAR